MSFVCFGVVVCCCREEDERLVCDARFFFEYFDKRSKSRFLEDAAGVEVVEAEDIRFVFILLAELAEFSFLVFKFDGLEIGVVVDTEEFVNGKARLVVNVTG